MKITKRQLRRIIREVAGYTEAEEAAIAYNRGYEDAEDGKESDPDLERNSEYSRGFMAGLTGSPARRARGGSQGIKEDVSGSAPYSGIGDISRELDMLETVFEDLHKVSLPAPMDMRIMAALKHIQQAVDALYGETVYMENK